MNYINSLLKGLAEGFQRINEGEALSKVGIVNTNLLTELYFDIVASYAANKITALREGRLSGGDVWAYSHAFRPLYLFVIQK